MDAARAISENIDTPDELDDGSLEMILYLTQKAVSDLKDLHQRNKYIPNYYDSFQSSPDFKI